MTVEKIKISDLTFEQCHQYHKELWNYLAETGSDSKLNWPGWDKFKGHVSNLCFACLIDDNLCAAADKDLEDCTYCPIVWPDGFGCQDGLYRSLWDMWCGCQTVGERKAVAKQMADVPWNLSSYMTAKRSLIWPL